MIKKFIADFSDKDIEGIIKLGKKYYLLNPDSEKIFKSIKLEIEAAGLFLGEDKKENFYPSLALLDILSKQSNRKMTVDDKAAWLFLCGRDIMAKSIIKSDVFTGIVLVQNSKNENLGIGRIVGDIKRSSDKIVVKNIIDKGDYLRREMDGKKK